MRKVIEEAKYIKTLAIIYRTKTKQDENFVFLDVNLRVFIESCQSGDFKTMSDSKKEILNLLGNIVNELELNEDKKSKSFEKFKEMLENQK